MRTLLPLLVAATLAAGCTETLSADDVALPDDLGAPPDLGASPDLALLPHCNATDPRVEPVAVSPTPEAGEAPYVDALGRAQRSIRVMVYLMGQGAILDTLVAKAKAGVTVQVMLDQSQIGTNQKYADTLAAAGAAVAWSDPQFTYMHAKFFVVDENEAVISTGNYSRTYSILLERNFVARDRDPADVADLVALFDADWARAQPMIFDCTRLLVSPVNARSRLLDLINSAQTSLTIESMQFADWDVRNAVKARKLAGVDVRALLAESSWISANADAATFLKALNIPVRSIPHLHTKVLVADGARAYLGSENFSYTSLTKNREVGLVVIDPSSVTPLVDTFEKDWAAGTSF